MIGTSRLRVILFLLADAMTRASSDCCGFVQDFSGLADCVQEHSSLKPAGTGYGVVSYASQSIMKYAAYTMAINNEYCSRHSYFYTQLNETTSNFCTHDQRWNKVKILLESLTGWAKDLSFLLWIDADAIFVNFESRLEDITESFPSSDLFASAEPSSSSTRMNSGVVLVRNSDFIREFLRRWWGSDDSRIAFSDQEQFDIVYKNWVVPNNMEHLIKILPPYAMNSDPPAMTRHRPGQMILHLMGEQERYRTHVFKEGFKKICEFMNMASGISGYDTLTPQLGLTKDNLMDWALDIYYSESFHLMAKFEDALSHGPVALGTTRALSNSMHHYAYALAHHSSRGNFSRSAELRVKVYRLLLSNVHLHRQRQLTRALPTALCAQKNNECDYDNDYPELLKATAEAGQLLLGIGSTGDRMRVAYQVMHLLQEIHNVCHPEQRSAILHMVAHMHSQIAFIDLDSQSCLRDDDSAEKANCINNALLGFQKSLEITQRLSEVSGDHLMASALTAVANMVSMQHSYSAAAQYYERAIEYIEKPNNIRLQQLQLARTLVNYGVSIYDSGKNVGASIRVFRRALGVLNVFEAEVGIITVDGATIAADTLDAEEDGETHELRRIVLTYLKLLEEARDAHI